LALTASATSSSAGYSAKEAPDACRNAHALLVASSTGKHTAIWNVVEKIVGADREHYEIVDDYEPGVAKKLSLRQYDIANAEGATAYVVDCGYGGTCNSLARSFVEKQPAWYPSEVFCGAVPDFLSNPQPAAR
jgi:hypothetical protein